MQKSARVLLHLIVVCLFVECGFRDAVADPAAPSPVKIGAVLPLTGEFGIWGERIRQGLTLALEDTRHKFQIDYQDEGNCDAKASLGAVKKFTSIDRTKLWIMGCLAGTKAAGSLAKREGALMFSTGLLDDETYTAGFPVINLATQISTEAKYLAAHIRAKELKRGAIVRWPDAFGEEFARALKLEFETHGAIVAYSESMVMGSDFRAIIQKIQASRADFVVFQLGEAQSEIFVKQLGELRVNLPLFSSYVVETNTKPSSLLNGIEYAYPLNSADDSPKKAEFDKHFIARFGSVPSINSYFAYDGLLALDAALQKCRTLDSGCILATFTKNTTSGIAGDVHYNPNGSSLRPYGIKRIVKSKFLWINKQVKL